MNPTVDEFWDEQDRIRRVRLLEAAGVAQAAKESLDLPDLARELDVQETTVRIELEELTALGLIFDGVEEGLAPILRTAGRQLLADRPKVPHNVLRFLPHVVADLHARQALMIAGTILVDEFRAAFLDGDPVDHARELVPPALAAAVDQRLALDLYAAAVALLARLSDTAPAGCVAEEVIAVSLIEEVRSWLELRRDEGLLTVEEEVGAAGELHGLFELFEDDDVLHVFEMEEPADVALAGHDPINWQLGVVDQRMEAWFDAFGGTAPTGTTAGRRSLLLRKHTE